MTQCIQQTFGFKEPGRRKAGAGLRGGNLSADGGALLLREVDLKTGLRSSSSIRSPTPNIFTTPSPLTESSIRQLKPVPFGPYFFTSGTGQSSVRKGEAGNPAPLARL